MASASTSTFPHPCRPLHRLYPSSSSSSAKPRTQTNFIVRPFTCSIPRATTTLSDPFVLQIAETLEDSTTTSNSSPSLQKLRDASSESLLSMSWPSRKDEPFRFTDISFIKKSQIQPTSIPSTSKSDLDLDLVDVDSKYPNNLVIVDGHVISSVSQLNEFPQGVYVGSISKISSEEIMARVHKLVGSFQNGDLFWSLNGIGAPDVTVVYVPCDCHVENPLYIKYYSCGNSDSESSSLLMSNPRVLVLVEKGGEIGVIEEYVGGDGDKCYWENSVMEVLIGEGAKFTHSYVQQESFNAAHIKWTSVQQESSSTYKLVEIGTGGKLSRHNLHVRQLGPDTVTELATFHLSIREQTQDLHSTVVLDHPRGTTQQLHKCIVAHSSGQAVFDGNVKVNRFAQQTNAGQLTRSLLLEPRATVNLKPNLQIIADDVKCSHGAAVSDLEDDQLFYFLARGIDLKTARKALVLSFGSEVIAQLPCDSLRKKVISHVQSLLEPVAQ